MKKHLLLIVLAMASTTAFAQNVSKNGHQITPEAGDWGLGIDVDPFFSYFGNIFNGTQNNSGPGWNFATNAPIPFVISGLMVKDETTAYRAKVRIGIGSQKTISVIDEDGSTSNPPGTVEDERKNSATNILVSAGLQKTRGKHRVKGIYGAEALIGSGNGGKSTFDYGNSFNLDSTSTSGYGQVTITDWNAGSGNSYSVSTRTTESKSGSTFYIGVRGFIGVEYFFAPKISIAGEFGWGLGFSATGEGEVKTETFDDNGTFGIYNDDTIISSTSTTGKSSSFGIDTDSGSVLSQGSGSIRMTFYF